MAASRASAPLRIYLDQKDFGRIAGALLRKDEKSADYVAYKHLQARVSNGQVRVYFSFVHVIEALRFGDVESPTAVTYCEVVDSLAKGHCIRAVPYLRQAELEIALSNMYGFATSYSRTDYPYGRHADALIGNDDDLLLGEDVRDQVAARLVGALSQISADARASLPNRHAIRAFLRNPPRDTVLKVQPLLPRGMTVEKFLSAIVTGSEDTLSHLARSLVTDQNVMRRLMDATPDAEFDEFNRTWPAGKFTWSREHAVTALAGTSAEREALGRQFFAGALSFSQLVGHYSRVRPDISAMGPVLDQAEVDIIDQLRHMQRFEPLRAAILGTSATWDRDISRDFGIRYLDGCRQDIRSYAKIHGFSPESAERNLGADNFQHLPYTRAVMLWLKAYLARHKGTKHARMPDGNDLRDALHCVNVPYVDVLVTERFAAEVSRPLADAFGTRVLKSLAELLPLLPPESGE